MWTRRSREERGRTKHVVRTRRGRFRDADLLRELFETIFERVHPLFAASTEAAAAAGDMVIGSVSAANGFWFGHHVAAMMAFVFLPARACLPYQGTLVSLVDETTRFILRGIGLTDTAIERDFPVARDTRLEIPSP